MEANPQIQGIYRQRPETRPGASRGSSENQGQILTP